MEDPKMTQENMKNSAPHGNLSNPSKKKKSNESSDPLGNLANPLNKKQKESDEKTNLLNKISVRKADKPPRFNLSRCQLLKKSALPPHQFCKGKHVVEMMDIDDQAIGIFQEEIIMEILSRLPVRSLHRFKCVSKVWKALISDPYFKKKHLNRAKNDQNLQRFLVGKMCVDTDNMRSFYSSSLSSVQLVEDEQKLELPSNRKPWDFKILCTCDGLVLLIVYEARGGPQHLLLWNPSIRESIELPFPKPSKGHCVCGMGYDTTSGDYKILAIDFTGSYEVSSEILTLKSGSWRVSKYPTAIRCLLGFLGTAPDCLAFLHGAFHWLGFHPNLTVTIVSFDISSEVYGEIPLLERMCHKLSTPRFIQEIERGISVLGGMLCFYSTFHSRVEGTFMLWVMKDYGVKESWTILFAIQDANLFHSAKPKYRYADGEVLLALRHLKRLSYVYRTSRGPFGLWPEERIFRQGIVYTESLISPKLLA